jgi:hypothetical protein
MPWRVLLWGPQEWRSRWGGPLRCPRQQVGETGMNFKGLQYHGAVSNCHQQGLFTLQCALELCRPKGICLEVSKG